MFDEHGNQIPDPTPVEIPVGFGHPESLEATIAKLVRLESQRARDTGEVESFEESDDFDLDDDNAELTSGFQMTAMQEEARDLGKSLDPRQKDDAPPVDKSPPDPDRQEFEAFKAWKEAQKKSKGAPDGAPTQ